MGSGGRMSDETITELVLGDGDIILNDPQELVRRFDALAIRNIEGELFILNKTSLQWKSMKELAPAGLRAIK